MAEKKQHVLVIEDEQDTAAMIKLALEGEGYEVSLAHTGNEGLNEARKIKPDLIILDVMLPKMDGFMVCRLLKFDDNYMNIPVIIVSAKIMKKDIECGKQMGADDYMTKPFDMNELLGKVKEFLKK